MNTFPVTTQMSIEDTLNFFENNFGGVQRPGTLWSVPLPNFTVQVVNEIAYSKSIPEELALLAFIPSIAAADCGHSRVVHSDGSTNSLSLFIQVGAESGTGKSLALEESLSVFKEWQEKKEAILNEKNARCECDKQINEEKKKKMMRKFINHGDPEAHEELYHLYRQKFEPIQLPQLILNDVTEAAFYQHLIENGFAIRLESDGILPPKKAMRVMTKSWS